MNEERLKEIKDYADFKIKLVLNEEKYIDVKLIKELYNEVIRLRKKLAIKKLFKKHKVQTPEYFELRKIFELQRKIEKAVEYINNGSYFDGSSMCKSDLLNILNGRSDE